MVFVAGSINMDIVARAERHPVIGETVMGSDLLFFPGGKGANQAVAAARLGADTGMIGRVGNDTFGNELVTFLQQQGVRTDQVCPTLDVATGTALIVVAESDNTIVVVPGANGRFEADDLEVSTFSTGDVLVSQFEIPVGTVEAFFAKGRKTGTINILNPAPARSCPESLLHLVDILVVNETELAALTHAEVIYNLREQTYQTRIHPDQTIIVTRGAAGVAALIGSDLIELPGRPVQAVDTTGAGDCFVGAMAARLDQGHAIRDALDYANTAASICVQRPGAGPSMPTHAEVMKG